MLQPCAVILIVGESVNPVNPAERPAERPLGCVNPVQYSVKRPGECVDPVP